MGSLEILPTKQAVSSGSLMALSPTKVGEIPAPDVSAAGISDQHTLTAPNVLRVLFVWLAKCCINVMNPFPKSKQKIIKPPQVLKQGHDCSMQTQSTSQEFCIIMQQYVHRNLKIATVHR